MAETTADTVAEGARGREEMQMGENEHPLSGDREGVYATGTKLWLLMLNIAAVAILSSIDMNIVATAVPSITDYFHTVADVGWAYKFFSPKKVFMIANLISILGSVLCGTAASSKMLIVGRAVNGVGSAGLFSGCFVILVQSAPLRTRPMLTALMGAVEGVATLSAPLLGGVLVQSLGWRWCFYINLPIGVATLLFTYFFFPDTMPVAEIARMKFSQKVAQMDLLSNLLFIPGLTCLFLAFSWAGTKYSWHSVPVVVPLAAFAVFMLAFLYNQVRRGDSAALPIRLFKNRSVVAGCIFIICINGTCSVLEYYLPTYYQVVRGYSPVKSGYTMLPLIVAATIGALVHGFGTSAWGYYVPFMLLASITMPIAAGLITTLEVTTSFAQLIGYTAFSGLAYGIGFSGPQNAVQTVLDLEDVPLGTSIMLFSQSFGPSVAIAVAQSLFLNRLSTNLDDIVPGFNNSSAGAIEKMGLTQIVANLPPSQDLGALVAIDKSLSQTWYLVVGLACATMIGSLSMEWRSVKTRRD